MFFIYSQSSAFRRIARELGVPVSYPYTGRTITRGRLNNLRTHINIGCARVDWSFIGNEDVYNKNIAIAVSKVQTYQRLTEDGIPCPQLMTMEEAVACGRQFLGRKDGLSGGRGIHVYAAGEVPARQHEFYTPVIACRREFRIHVWNARVICIQKKRLANATSIVHNHDNGVVFQTIPMDQFNIGTERTALIRSRAVSAVGALGLDFGAVDILQERDTNELYVLEVNTAPGISSEPAYNAYLQAIRDMT